MLDRPESRPRPEWLNKMIAAKAAALQALTPEELAEAEAVRSERKARVEARRLASIERAKTIFSMFADGHSDIEIGRRLLRNPDLARQAIAAAFGAKVGKSTA